MYSIFVIIDYVKKTQCAQIIYVFHFLFLSPLVGNKVQMRLKSYKFSVIVNPAVQVLFLSDLWWLTNKNILCKLASKSTFALNDKFHKINNKYS